MNDSNSAGSTPGATRPTNSPARVLAVVLPIAIVGLAAYWWSTNLESKAQGDFASTVVARIFVSEPLPTGAKMAFDDADNDMVADPPSDPAQLVNPDTLVFSYVATGEEGLTDDTWTELFTALKEKTGKEVKVVHFTTPNEQMASLKKGELHIVGFNTGLVQRAVEEFGFVPLCTLGHADGSWGYTMNYIVPAGSSIEKLEDIKGHRVMFTRLDSNSGCKAPLVLLKEKYNLLPGRDYKFGFSRGHEDSIKGVASKDFEVAPVASDVLARMIENKEIDPAAVVSIYKSERFPPATIGDAYNLSPELRDGIRDTLLAFEWKNTGLEKQFGPEGKEKFVPVNYKEDWANTRRISQVIAELRKAGAPPKHGT